MMSDIPPLNKFVYSQSQMREEQGMIKVKNKYHLPNPPKLEDDLRLIFDKQSTNKAIKSMMIMSDYISSSEQFVAPPSGTSNENKFCLFKAYSRFYEQDIEGISHKAYEDKNLNVEKCV